MQSNLYLMHHGIKGQKCGVRRFQNEDGTLTAEGKDRYGNIENFKNRDKNLKKFYHNLKRDPVSQTNLASMATASTVTKQEMQQAYDLISTGRLYVTATFKQNKKENAVDIYLRGLKSPVARAYTRTGEDFCVDFLDEHGAENYEAFMAYSIERSKRN